MRSMAIWFFSMKKFLVISFLLMCCGLAACGSEDEGSTGTSTVAVSKDEGPPSWPRLERAAQPYAKQLLIPTGPPPKSVVIRDLKKGSGPPIQPKEWFTVNYISFAYPSRQVTEDKRGENSWYWKWGDEALTQGWEIGLKGLRVGGVRELIVPSRLAYGSGALVYVVKLLKLTPTQSEALSS